MRIANPLHAMGLLAGLTAGRAGSAALSPAARGPVPGKGSSAFGQLVRGKSEAHGVAKPKKRPEEEEQPLDPMLAQSAVWSPPGIVAQAAASPAAPVERQARQSLEDILPALVRRIAWSGDARRGTMRLELAGGALSGATLVVHADDGRVQVELNAPPGTDPAAWKARIESRLAARGIAVDAVHVE